jgi:hypothetical protein
MSLSCQWSLMSLITGNKVKKKHTSQGIVCHILKKTKRTIKSYGSAARLDQAIVIKA